MIVDTYHAKAQYAIKSFEFFDSCNCILTVGFFFINGGEKVPRSKNETKIADTTRIEGEVSRKEPQNVNS